MARQRLDGAAGRSILRGVSLALNFYLLDVRPFWLATILVVANTAALTWTWRRSAEASRFSNDTDTGARGFSRAFIPALAISLLFAAAHAWLTQILTIPIDAQRADMLVVVQLGIRRLLQGHTPYTIYRVPWDVTLPYGPVMWAPMIVPFLLHADIRFATIVGALFVPAACALAAVRAARRDLSTATAWLLVCAAIAFNGDLRQFIAIGHTPAYWPLLPLFAWALARERWVAAAIFCGLLIVARTTMVSLTPALLMAVWQRAGAAGAERTRRASFAYVVVALAAAVALPLLPFAVVDLASLKFAFYTSYQNVIKGFVWTSTNWVQNTVGTTGLLLARGWTSAVEPVQIVALLAVSLATWARLRRGDDAVVWSAIGLLAFSMTTLWPVVYLYFDVFLLLVSAALVREWPDTARVWPWWSRSLASAALVLLVVTLATVPMRASIDVGTPAARPWLYAGFSGDERADRDYAWIDGTRAKLLVPSLLRRDATIEMVCEPYLVAGGRQQLTAALNTIVLGTVEIADGWQRVSFRAPARAWQIGGNELELFLASATAPRDAGEGSDTRRLSLAVDRLNVIAR